MGSSSPMWLDESDTGLRERKRRPATRSRTDLALRVVQSLLLAPGAMLLIVYAAAQVDAVRARARALEAFAVARSDHVVVSEPATSPSVPLEYSSGAEGGVRDDSKTAACSPRATANASSACARVRTASTCAAA